LFLNLLLTKLIAENALSTFVVATGKSNTICWVKILLRWAFPFFSYMVYGPNRNSRVVHGPPWPPSTSGNDPAAPRRAAHKTKETLSPSHISARAATSHLSPGSPTTAVSLPFTDLH
jgi:hypothetical protein